MKREYKVRPILTSRRLEWLQHLADHGPEWRSNRWGHAPYCCIVLGWTTWEGQWTRDYTPREMLTDAGRQVLAKELERIRNLPPPPHIPDDPLAMAELLEELEAVRDSSDPYPGTLLKAASIIRTLHKQPANGGAK